jgi:hypothetical protein
MLRVLAPVFLALCVAGCRAPEGPAERYRRFSDLAREGKAENAWPMLSSSSRARFEARARELAAQAPAGVIAASGPELLLGDLAVTAPRVKSAMVVRESKDAAVLSVEEEGGTKREVSLVREDGAWRVVVPERGG